MQYMSVFFGCANCKDWVKSLKGVQAIWAAVTEMVQEEVRGNVVAMLELQTEINRYKRSSPCCLQYMLSKFMYIMKFGVAERRMVEWEVEETSRDDNVDSME